MLVGRGDVLERICVGLRDGHSWALVGEAGMGKTAVLRALQAHLGGHAAFGAAVEPLRWTPYLPLSDACGQELAGTPRAVTESAAARLAGRVLLLDDLHWADQDTLDVLPELAMHVPVVTAVRSDEPNARAALQIADAFGKRIQLPPLDPNESFELAAYGAPGATTRELAELVAASRGNPLLLTCAPGRSAAPDNRPLALVQRASPAARHSLARLALSGRPVARADVPAADELEALGLLLDDRGWCRPRHDLLADAAVTLLTDAERASLHRELAAEATSHAERAHHFLAAGDLDAARRSAQRAAASATSLNERANHAAIVAATVVDGDDDELLLEAAETLCHAGRVDEGLVVAQRAAPTDRTGTLRRATTVARCAWWAADHALARTAIDEALALLHPADWRFEATLRVLNARYLTRIAWDAGAGMCEARRALDIAQAHELPLAEAYGALGAASVLSRDPSSTEWLDASIAAARAENDFPVEATSADTLWVALLLAGDATRCLALAEEMIDRARVHGVVSTERQFRKNRLVARFHHVGDLDGVIAEARALLRLPLNPRQRDHVESHLVVALADSGRDDETPAILDTAYGFHAPDLTARAMILWAKAEADWQAGRFEDALDAANECRALPITGFPAQVLVDPVRQWALLELGLEPGDALQDVMFRNLAGARAESAAVVAMHVHPEDSANVDAFLAAAAAYKLMSVRGELRCRWAAGEAAARAGDAARARALLEPLDAQLRRERRLPLVRRVGRTLRDVGVRPRPARTRPEGVLTGAESEILELVSIGLETRAIARRLLVSELTVQSHVRNAARKFGVRTRLAAAVEMLRQRGELDPRSRSEQRFVIPTVDDFDATVRELAAGRAVYPICALPPSPWNLGSATVGYGSIGSDDEVERALIAAVRGMSLVLTFDVALAGDARSRLLQGLERLGTIQIGPMPTSDDEIGVELMAGLRVLAAGGTIADAARALHVSQRTLHRQLAALRLRLNVATNAAAARSVLSRDREI